MGAYVVGAAIAVALVATLSRLARRAWLDAYPLLPGERVLLEVPVRAQMLHGRTGRLAAFSRAHARVTDRRVLLGQRPLLGKVRGRYLLFAVIDLDRRQSPVPVPVPVSDRWRAWGVMSTRRRDVVSGEEWLEMPVEAEAGSWSGTTRVWLTAGQGQPSLVRAIASAAGPPLPPV